MIGLILLFISIVALERNKYVLALLIMLSFVSCGFRLLPDSLIGIKNDDLALGLLMTWTVLCKNMQIKYERIKTSYTYKLIIGFSIFLFASAIFSIIHYDFSLIQVVQGGRLYFVILLFFILIKIDAEYIKYVLLKPVFYITIIVAVLYIMQVITGTSILPAPANDEISIDSSTGIARFYNPPMYLKFYLYALCLTPEILNIKHKNWIIGIFLLSLLCTQGRTNIGTTIAILFLGLLLQNKYGRVMKFVLIGSIIVLPFMDAITNRLEGNNTDGDIENVLNGNFIQLAKQRGTPSGTMEYRLAWVYERSSYLIERPISEQIFGLGMISDSQPVVCKKYNFFYGLTNHDTNMPYQLGTPDVSLGDMITKFGFGGSILLYSIWVSILVYFYRNRKLSPFSFVGFIFILSTIVGSISNNSLARISNLIFYLLIFLIVQSNVSANITNYKQ